MRKLFWAILIAVMMIAETCLAYTDAGKLKVSVLNVGQGDAILIETPEQNVLIDTSDIDERTKLEYELGKLKVRKLDKVILTHPHADHIGGMGLLLKYYDIGAVYDNGIAAPGKLYQDYVSEVSRKGIVYKHPVAGEVIDFGGGASFKVYSPSKALVNKINSGKAKSSPNNESIVGMLEFGEFKMLFTGDAESKIEEELLCTPAYKLKANVLKAGHHGSQTASMFEFVKEVSPEVVVISAGEPTTKRGGNTYGHPHKRPLETYKALGAKVYCTYPLGTITITTDGETYDVATQ